MSVHISGQTPSVFAVPTTTSRPPTAATISNPTNTIATTTITITTTTITAAAAASLEKSTQRLDTTFQIRCGRRTVLLKCRPTQANTKAAQPGKSHRHFPPKEVGIWTKLASKYTASPHLTTTTSTTTTITVTVTLQSGTHDTSLTARASPTPPKH
ncbi:hypothetical protein E2C01_017540 [Portunus trituberculatus]|uniref:Uncharacterized protein n=1 Tax=Portunus trituberculatus TaxID=210409 RepID=A0A5B7DTR5_PORTR|nr:hypothetical protein [Portunus trituberculatus]